MWESGDRLETRQWAALAAWAVLAVVRVATFYRAGGRAAHARLDRLVIPHLLLCLGWLAFLGGLADFLERQMDNALVPVMNAQSVRNGQPGTTTADWFGDSVRAAAATAAAGLGWVAGLSLVLAYSRADRRRPDVARAFVALRLLGCGVVALVWGVWAARLTAQAVGGTLEGSLTTAVSAAAVAVPAAGYHLWLLHRPVRPPAARPGTRPPPPASNP